MFPGKCHLWWCILVLSVGVVLACEFELPDYTVRENGNMNFMLMSVHGGEHGPSIQSNGDPWPSRQAGCYIGGSCVWNHDCVTEDASKCKVVTSNDKYTKEVATEIKSKIVELTGSTPHFVYSNLKREKLDANREIGQATLNVTDAVTAYHDFHTCAAKVRDEMEDAGPGLIIDIHGYGTRFNVFWLMLGYKITASRLNGGNFWPTLTSIESLGKYYCPNDKGSNWQTSTCFKNLIRGDGSLGYYFNNFNYTAVPSPDDLSPGSTRYFSGGYNAGKYGSKTDGHIDFIQIELPHHMRKDFEDYSDSFAKAIICYYKEHYDQNLPTNGFSC